MKNNNNQVHVTFELDREFSSELVGKLIETVRPFGYQFYHGALIDNYLFHMEGLDVKLFGDYPTGKYIILREKSLNTWQSTYQVTITDDDSLAREFEKEATEYWSETD